MSVPLLVLSFSENVKGLLTNVFLQSLLFSHTQDLTCRSQPSHQRVLNDIVKIQGHGQSFLNPDLLIVTCLSSIEQFLLYLIQDDHVPQSFFVSHDPVLDVLAHVIGFMLEVTK